MAEDRSILNDVHPLVGEWFGQRFGEPTPVQRKAWPRIACGDHVLITAPTGSGKTLTAFLWAVDRLIQDRPGPGRTRILYVSPLKALNNDIRRNLTEPIAEIRARFERAGRPFPQIRVLTRSGDTPQAERRRMLRHPPEILITTPESLNLMLGSAGGRSILASVATVILDEIHAVVGGKRGTYLITAVERLVPLAGEFQRIALSATVHPLETVAGFVGGFTLDAGTYRPRPVRVIRDTGKRDFDLTLDFPAEAPQPDPARGPGAAPVLETIAGTVRKSVRDNRSTLVFVNSRRLCERLTFMVNGGLAEPVAYAHHGSLSRELREAVEENLRSGALRAIVATNSLELGIDIGALDQVLLVQTPPSITSGVQRVGRAGHRMDLPSRGLLLPTHPQDAVASAVLAAGIARQDIEPVRPVRCPLDVLAQVIVSMAGTETWDVDRLYAQLRTAYPYRGLTRTRFDLVLDMLAGRYADSRIRALRPQVSLDRLDRTVRSKKGALLTLYRSGGVIPDRGYFHLRHRDTNARIGELDEEFVWEAKKGQTFTLGTQNWRIERITHSDVLVLPAGSGKGSPPFWIAEERHRSYHFSDRIGRFLERADRAADKGELLGVLHAQCRMTEAAATGLADFLTRQKSATGCSLPHRHHLLVEHVTRGPSGFQGHQTVMHTLWGGRLNRPFAMALAVAWEDRYGGPLEVHADNDCVYLVLADEVPDPELMSLVDPDNLERLLRRCLDRSGFFGARFRECAGRALLIPRRRMNQRMPLWASRLKSKKLIEAVAAYEDFPILLETWRTCLEDSFDLTHLRQVLAELADGRIAWTAVFHAYPSPMALTGTWRQINAHMYRKDSGAPPGGTRLREDLIEELALTPALRPTVAEAVVRRFEAGRQRLRPGYPPDTPEDLLDWVKERVLVPEPEWKHLLRAAERDHGTAPEAMVGSVTGKLVMVRPGDGAVRLVAALENAPEILKGFYGGGPRRLDVTTLSGEDLPVDLRPHLARPYRPPPGETMPEARARLLGEWLSFYGPVPVPVVEQTLGIPAPRLGRMLDEMSEARRIVTGTLVTGGGADVVCDRENFEALLRLTRMAAAPSFEPVDITALPRFLSAVQGLAAPGNGLHRLYDTLERLLCFQARADLWESEIFPARMNPYDPSWLDAAMQDGDLAWIGGPGRGILFCFASDLDLLTTEEGKAADGQEAKSGEVDDLFPGTSGRYTLSELLHPSGLSPSVLTGRLWSGVWKGAVSNDSAAALRKGIENRFTVPGGTGGSLPVRGSGGRSGRFSRWKAAVPFGGNWFRVRKPAQDRDPVRRAERRKERARLLLDRYGVLFRELLTREPPAFQWRNVFRALRMMELAGEVLAGHFFTGVPGPQFIAPKALKLIQETPDPDAVFWVNAVDPASVCGIPLDALRGTLPRRVAGTHLVYRGGRMALVSRRYGRHLTFDVPADDPGLPGLLEVFHHLLGRRFQPLNRITIERINGSAAARSPYRHVFAEPFDMTVEPRNVVLYRRV